MLMEVLQRLDRLPPRLSSYRYVGFGGIYFTDFVHAHRHLGIADMISIERSFPKERFDFNNPLACITLRFGSAGEHLPSILAAHRVATVPAIFWLDYDGVMDTDVLADITTLASAATPLTFFAVTVNCDPGALNTRLDDFKRHLGDAAPPDIIEAAQLGGWKLGNVDCRLMLGTVASALVERNAALPPEEQLRYRQLVRFHYADGAQMMTAGGILHTDDQVEAIDEAMVGLPQVRAEGEDALLVDAPVLTAREVRHLSAQLPRPAEQPPTSPGVPSSDAARFAALYRQYPLYAPVEIL